MGSFVQRYTSQELFSLRSSPLSCQDITLPKIKYLTYGLDTPKIKSFHSNTHYRNRKPYKELIAVTQKIPSEKKETLKAILNKITNNNIYKLKHEFIVKFNDLTIDKKEEMYDFISDKILFEYPFIELYIKLISGLNKTDKQNFYKSFKTYVNSQRNPVGSNGNQLNAKKIKSIGRLVAIAYVSKEVDTAYLRSAISFLKGIGIMSGLIEIVDIFKTIYTRKPTDLKKFAVADINGFLNRVLKSEHQGIDFGIDPNNWSQEKFRIMDHFNIRTLFPPPPPTPPPENHISEKQTKIYENTFNEFISLCGADVIHTGYEEILYYVSQKDFDIVHFLTVAVNNALERIETHDSLKKLIEYLERDKLLSPGQKLDIFNSFDIKELEIDIPGARKTISSILSVKF